MAGCQRIECAEFQLDHPLMGWHWFADLQPGYTYVNAQGGSVQLVRTEYDRAAAEKRWCHMCACYTELQTDYTCAALNTLFQCNVEYEGLAGPDENGGSVYYGVNPLASSERGYSSFGSRDSTLEEYVSDYLPQRFTVRRRTTVTLLTTPVADVLELTVLDTATAGVETVWVKKGQGLLAFRRRGVVWLKQ
ncbi:hypothetical protein [Hymenobacter jeollabukensis]|uniref:Uncharacterized protein n=1 Tax=Hymenobacter jeollabukensis TaxID=2025313 RepID=A0A5R8WPR2_9BACT|nr:hypothetical protein [Hymenobacter jeollabukensis]TLM91722.1 hypothetical protein FDY95_14265 [Hymenobacter jeollabukensis]